MTRVLSCGSEGGNSSGLPGGETYSPMILILITAHVNAEGGGEGACGFGGQTAVMAKMAKMA